MFKNGRTYPGNPMTFTITITDNAGDAVDPDTVTFKLMNPCGRTTTYVYTTDDEVTRSAAGVYVADVIPDSAGRWHYRWVTTGDVLVQEDSFIVQTSPFVDDCCRDYV